MGLSKYAKKRAIFEYRMKYATPSSKYNWKALGPKTRTILHFQLLFFLFNTSVNKKKSSQSLYLHFQDYICITVS